MSAYLLGSFVPTDTVPRTVDPLTHEMLPPRRATSDEQEREAIEYALDKMLELRIWSIALPVEWARRPATTLSILGHAEHIGRRIVPVFDEITDEIDVDGVPVDRSPTARFERLQAELEDTWDADGL